MTTQRPEIDLCVCGHSKNCHSKPGEWRVGRHPDCPANSGRPCKEYRTTQRPEGETLKQLEALAELRAKEICNGEWGPEYTADLIVRIAVNYASTYARERVVEELNEIKKVFLNRERSTAAVVGDVMIYVNGRIAALTKEQEATK